MYYTSEYGNLDKNTIYSYFAGRIGSMWRTLATTDHPAYPSSCPGHI